jgi:galacturonokinase
MSFHLVFVSQLNEIKDSKPTMAGRGPEEERVVVSPCRICPLDARIDHQVLFTILFLIFM